MQDDAQIDALRQEALELDRQLVDYVVARLDQMVLVEAIEARIAEAVRTATSGQISGLSDDLRILRNELARTSDDLKAMATAAASPALAAPQSEPMRTAHDPARLEYDAPDHPDELPPELPASTRAERKHIGKGEPETQPVRKRGALLPWGLAGLAVIGCGAAGMVAWQAEARADDACKKAQFVRGELLKAAQPVEGLKKEPKYVDAYEAVKRAEKAPEGGAAGETGNALELTFEQRMVQTIENQRVALERFGNTLKTACSTPVASY